MSHYPDYAYLTNTLLWNRCGLNRSRPRLSSFNSFSRKIKAFPPIAIAVRLLSESNGHMFYRDHTAPGAQDPPRPGSPFNPYKGEWTPSHYGFQVRPVPSEIQRSQLWESLTILQLCRQSPRVSSCSAHLPDNTGIKCHTLSTTWSLYSYSTPSTVIFLKNPVLCNRPPLSKRCCGGSLSGRTTTSSSPSPAFCGPLVQHN